MAKVTVGREPPDTADAAALLKLRDAELDALYPPEESFKLPPERHRADDVVFLVAREDGQALGCGALQLHDGYAELKSMFVRNEARGRGIAARLVKALEEEALGRGIRLLRLETGIRSPAAIRAYEKAGYAVCERFGDYPPVASSVFMEKRLWANPSPTTGGAATPPADTFGGDGIMSERLEDIANRMVAEGKGILAADESGSTIKKRFDSIGMEATEEARRDYRELLFRSPAMRDYISGVILYDETLRQKAADGTPLVALIKEAGAVPGIKVDQGAKPLALSPGETITEGLDGLRERLSEYHGLGARFAKWRAVITIGPDGRPSWNAIKANAHALARYAALCQEAGIVPIVEPEVQMDGPDAVHDIDACYQVSEWTLNTVFDELYDARILLEGIVLKPNMVTPGQRSQKRASVEEVAEKTVRVLKSTVPAAVPGIAFLSGGQSDEEATAHLSAMNAMYDLPWKLTFSYGRALQAAAIKAWGGKPENVAAAQTAFAHRARMNALAARGRWAEEEERKAA